MLNKKFLMLASISALLATTVFGAGTQNCVGGVCFINLEKLNPSKGFEQKKERTVLLEKPRYIEDCSVNNIDKSMTIVLDGEMITVFPKSSYVMNEEEAMDFMLLAKPIEGIEDKILEQMNLPSSEYFCEKDKHAVYLNNNTYECV
jgi:hypothetical protein